MTNEQLKERIKLLERIIELETKIGLLKSGGAPVESEPWYPDNRNWIECNPSMNIDRSMVAEVLYKRERESKIYAVGAPDLRFNDTAWNDEFSWDCDVEERIVAVLMKE